MINYALLLSFLDKYIQCITNIMQKILKKKNGQKVKVNKKNYIEIE